MTQLSDFVNAVEANVAMVLHDVADWLHDDTVAVTASGSNSVVWKSTLNGKPVTLKAKLGLDGATVYTLVYEAFEWVVTNPQVIAIVKNLVQNWINSLLPASNATPVANT